MLGRLQPGNQRIAVILDIKLETGLRKDGRVAVGPNGSREAKRGLAGPEQATRLSIRITRDPETAVIAPDEKGRDCLV